MGRVQAVGVSVLGQTQSSPRVRPGNETPEISSDPYQRHTKWGCYIWMSPDRTGKHTHTHTLTTRERFKGSTPWRGEVTPGQEWDWRQLCHGAGAPSVLAARPGLIRGVGGRASLMARGSPGYPGGCLGWALPRGTRRRRGLGSCVHHQPGARRRHPPTGRGLRDRPQLTPV